jgi:beta-galactosidase
MKGIAFYILLLQVTLPLHSQPAMRFFPPSQLISTGVYYYPERWDSAEWEGT